MSKVAENKTFEEKMKDRIKDSIGDLISDEDLSKLVNRGIQEVYFDKRTEKEGQWNTKEYPPLMHEIIKSCLDTQVQTCVREYLNKNSELVIEQVKQIVTEGVGMAVIKSLNSKFSSDMWMMENNITNKLRNNTY